ncbi:LuxR C-terminal-related transcriptional regulator [Candidatus Protofrankia californiensis]|uniref:LuxR C-terminal-related transcriptional regulator n=1 Tax=Candidatus Protofrankia californiensis TaxID=1839754 RepID=UPI001041A3B5|nr:LuxR C-terminal-related transcriptional regulator [Candidatus Protofrankia californiensis]
MSTENARCYERSRRPTIGDRVYQRSISDQTLSEVLDTVRQAEKLLTGAGLPKAADIVDLPSAADALGCVWRGVRAALHGDHAAGEQLANTDDLVTLLIRARQTDEDLERQHATRRSATLRRAQSALSQFHQSGFSVAELIETTPVAVCALGFDRAIFSRIHDSLWVAESLHVEGDPDWAEQILQAGRESPEPLAPPLFETEIVRTRRPITVPDGQQRPRVHQAISRVSQTRSYVAAPVMPRGDVIGFLHADCYFQRRELTDLDRDLLSVFAAGFSYALDRAILLDRLAGLRARILRFAEDMILFVHERSPLPTPRSSTPFDDELVAPTSDPAHRRIETPLTHRELDVLRLMTQGHTNHQIASKLVISEGTVKSHVKRILRKLVAANRAEAVSIWLNTQR